MNSYFYPRSFYLILCLALTIHWGMSAQDTFLVDIKPIPSSIVSMTGNERGDIWFNTYSDLYAFDGKEIKWVKKLPLRKTILFKNGKVQYYTPVWKGGKPINAPWNGNEHWARHLPPAGREIFTATDKRGITWITAGQHLYGYSIQKGFRSLLNGHSLRGILQHNGAFLVNSYSGLIHNGKIPHPDLYSNGNLLAQSADKIWIPSLQLVLYDLKKDTIEKKFPYERGVSEREVDYLLQTPKHFWIASAQHGLFQLDRDTVRKTAFNIPIEHMSAWNNTLYLATRKGIYGGKDEDFSKLDAFPVQQYNFVQRFDDTLLAASRQGIWYLENLSSPKAKKLFPNEPLGDLETYCILQDRLGYFWVSTNAGIYRFQIETPLWEAYLTHVEFNKRSCASLQDSLFFGSVNGLYAFRPDSFPRLRSSEPLTAGNNYFWRYVILSFSAAVLIGCIILFYKRWKKARESLFLTLQQPNKDEERIPLIDRLESYIEENLLEINVLSLSEYSGLSQRSLYRFLKETYGLTPGDLIRDVRIKKAKQLLEANPHIRKEELVFRTGVSIQQLNRVFS